MIPGVPYDAEIEYLESTGTQWIDTGVVWNPTQTKIVGKIHYSKEAGAYNAAPQSRDTVGSTMYYYGFNLKNSSLNPVARLQVANVFVDNRSFVTQLNTQYNFSVECNNNNIVALVDNQTICTLTNASSLRVSTNTLYLYARNQGNGDIGVYADGLCYHILQIYAGNTLVRDFIPVRVGQTGYMYDRVSKRLFGNKGTGSFVLGPDVAKPVMGLYGMRKFYNARDYVQDGLVAMFDGIENDRWGIHNPNATVWKDLMGNEQPLFQTQNGSASNPGLLWGDTYAYNFMQSMRNDPIARDYSANGFTVQFVAQRGWAEYSINILPNLTDYKNIAAWGAFQDNSYYRARFFGVETQPSVRHYYTVQTLKSCPGITFSVKNSTTGTVYFNAAQYPLTIAASSSPITLAGTACIRLGVHKTNYHNSPVNAYRLYNKCLSTDEIAHNYAIDKERFNLP